MILLAESRLSNEFILKFDVAKGCVLFLFSLLYKDSHIHTKAHVCIYNGVNIFCIWYCSTCSSIVRVLNCVNVIIKIGMISYGKSRFLVFRSSSLSSLLSQSSTSLIIVLLETSYDSSNIYGFVFFK